MDLDIGMRQVHDVTVVDIRGRLAFGAGAGDLREALHRMTREGYRKVLLNLGGVSSIDSSGLGVLVSAFSRMTYQGTEVKLLNLPGRITELLLTTKLFSVFEVFDDEAAALRTFGQTAAATGSGGRGSGGVAMGRESL